MRPILKRLLRLIPSYRMLEARKQQLIAECGILRARIATLEAERGAIDEWVRFAPPGHFNSPLPSHAEIAAAYSRGGFGPPFPAVDLNAAEQLTRLERFAAYYPEQPFPDQPTAGRRFHLANSSYGHHDAIMLYCMLRESRPGRIVEVGSGFSSAAILDLNEHVFGGAMEYTIIDPDLSRLHSLLGPDAATCVRLVPQAVQDVPMETFAALKENDVLFIDSSHVSKVGSDVNRLIFDVLPALAPGVLIHFHDITGNLEYPRAWLEEGRAWNELYLLRAFLMYNPAFRIELFSRWLAISQAQFLRERMPLCATEGGGQLWLRKLAH
jgi:predicted O-methyltransferase YrrM